MNAVKGLSMTGDPRGQKSLVSPNLLLELSSLVVKNSQMVLFLKTDCTMTGTIEFDERNPTIYN